MTEPSLLVTTNNKVTTILLNRHEKCNALDSALIQQLKDAFFTAGRNPETQLVLLQGKGKHFCSGVDIDWMLKLAQSSFEHSRDDAQNLASLLSQMHAFPKPIITLAQGTVVGGGLGLLACSDIVLCAEEASFCFSEVKIGLVPAVISPYVLSIMGESAARYYFLTGERFNALEAHRLGLVQAMVPEEDLDNAGLRLAQKLLGNSPTALTEVKRLIRLVSHQEISLELTEKTAEIFARLRVSHEAREGLQAFKEKRPPSWS